MQIVLEPTTLENLKLRLLHVLDNEGNLLEFVQPLGQPHRGRSLGRPHLLRVTPPA